MPGQAEPTETDPEIVEPTETVEVPAGGEEPEPAAGGGDPSPEAVASRKERRANRMREETAAREAAETARRQSDERAARLEREVSELRGFVSAQAQRDQPDPRAAVTAKIEKLESEAEDLLNQASMAARAKDDAGAKRLMRAYNGKLREAAEISAEARLMPIFQQQLQQIQQNLPNTQMLAQREAIMRDFPWMAANEEAQDLTDVITERLVAGGHPRSFETIKLAAAQAGKRLGLGGREKPSQQTRQRFQLPAGGEGGGGEGEPARIEMGPREKKLAHLTFKELEPKAAEKKWAAEMAKAQRASKE